MHAINGGRFQVAFRPVAITDIAHARPERAMRLPDHGRPRYGATARLPKSHLVTESRIPRCAARRENDVLSRQERAPSAT